jgi:hypothetical protein
VFDSTAPGPRFGAFDESRADGVVEHVGDRVVVVLLVVDHPGGEARTKERALAPEAGVVLAGVVALEPLDGRRESLDRPVDDGVVVGRHQAVGVEAERQRRRPCFRRARKAPKSSASRKSAVA